MLKIWEKVSCGLSVKWIILHYGPLDTLRWIWRSLPYHLWLHFSRSGREELTFDTSYGVETDGIVEPAHFGLYDHGYSVADAVHYAPTKPRRLVYLLNNLTIDYRQFTFVDIGAGKGRALLLAAKLPFRRVVGVEFSPGLATIAQKNAEIFARINPGSAPIEVICGDASEYELPNENLVIYLFNPFNGATFARFLTGLERSLRDNFRTVYVVYWSPMSEQQLTQCGFLEKFAGRRDQFAVYRTLGASSSAGNKS
ncbi:MAG: class I SAM-dependent methyltransferase [Deltaproteobacteria bacterium]|nr:class I SAM-dependent methyltransferase [Deltaproteobacteria bacterium]